MRLSLRTTLTVALLAATACGGATAGAPGDDGTVDVVAAFYPLAWAAERVGGAEVDVTNLTPPGVEPHDLELTSEALEAIAAADVVVTMGVGFQPAIDDAVAAEATGVVVTIPPAGDDPHIWLEPRRFVDAVEDVAAGLIEAGADPTPLEEGRAGLVEDLEQLDADLDAGLADCDRRTLLVNHDAFGLLAAAYGLTQESISGLSPEAEPDPARIAALAELARETASTTVFTEPLAPADVADTLAAEAGLVTAVLDPVEGLDEERIVAGEDYLSVMRTNLETLRDGLGCR
ncbi:MAG TPA: zinc ABC transporter substrate-binding protein [Actinomycetota bacterium]|nr:zinc ABC transporter substrate-binding protein [Actinomycetota bacterium]